MYVETLTLENLRCFERVGLDLVHPGRAGPPIANVTLVLGDNGAGKTTLLRAIVMATLGQALVHSGFVPYRLIRRAGEEEAKQAHVTARLRLDAGEKHPDGLFHTTLMRRGNFDSIVKTTELGESAEQSLYDESSPAFFLVGYGSTRRVETSDRIDLAAREKVRLFRYQRVATLFEDHVSLMPLSAWLPRLHAAHPERRDEVFALMNELLGGQARMTDKREGADYMFEVGGVEAPFPALSDGYRAFIGWVGDLLFHMCQACPPRRSLRRLPGVVLIDEIDLHLHPDWQRTVVPQISAALPELQFVFTTHSALVAGTLHSDNIRVVATETGRPSQVKQLQERIHGLGVDQILLGGYFDLTTTRAPDVAQDLLALARRARDGDQEASVAVLRLLARGPEHTDATGTAAPARPRKTSKKRSKTPAEPSARAKRPARQRAKKTAKKPTRRKAG